MDRWYRPRHRRKSGPCRGNDHRQRPRECPSRRGGATSLIRRFATTDEVANMIVYVCSEQASATTGAALRVDGGVVRFVA
ncbi:MAG TPA: SDR family oxidoreductase [Steroidobacteraceae bacterium]|nr:SDR family oxidoreductase [Steroidobacteraceae bacterium]